MDPIVLIMVLAIYIGAVVAPCAVFILARRTGHGLAWQYLPGLCGAVIWLALVLGFLREALDVAVPGAVLEAAGFLGVISFAILSIVALVLAAKPWPGPVREEGEFPNSAVGRLVADLD